MASKTIARWESEDGLSRVDLTTDSKHFYHNDYGFKRLEAVTKDEAVTYLEKRIPTYMKRVI